MTDVTCILSAIEQGNPHTAAQVLPLVYDESRRLGDDPLREKVNCRRCGTVYPLHGDNEPARPSSPRQSTRHP